MVQNTGKYTVITGASSGIGYETAKAFAERVGALTVFSSLFVRDFKDTEGTQLINVSSSGGYAIVSNAVTHCAAKFYVSVFTEGLAWELKAAHANIQAKVLAPAATKTEDENSNTKYPKTKRDRIKQHNSTLTMHSSAVSNLVI